MNARKRELGSEPHPFRNIRPALTDGRQVTNVLVAVIRNIRPETRTVLHGGRSALSAKVPIISPKYAESRNEWTK